MGLRIFLSSQQSARRHAVPAYGFWEHYFKNGLVEAGHDWIEAPEVDWAEGLLPFTGAARRQWLDRTWSPTLAFLRQEHARRPIDLFLSYLFPAQVESAAVHAIRALGIPCVNFFCDNVREFRRIPPEFGAFDLHWVPEAEAIPLYRREKLAAIHAPMPCWVDPRHRRAQIREETGPSFLGSRDDLRAALLARAIALGARIQIYGNAWIGAPRPSPASAPGWGRLQNQAAFVRRQGFRAWSRKLGQAFRPPLARLEPPPECLGPVVSADDYVRLTQRSEVTLGINRFPSFRHPPDRVAAYSRLRDVEAPMLGACYLTEWTEDIPHLYEPGEEIETYRTAEELAEKMAVLHSEPARRQQLRVLGQRRALECHTVGRSLARISEALDLKA